MTVRKKKATRKRIRKREGGRKQAEENVLPSPPSKEPIFVIGYPKSGTTWLTRLLGDVLQAPTGGCWKRWDSTEIATEGWDRLSDFIVRKGHYTLDLDGKFQRKKRAHVLTLRDITKHRGVHIVRDPRDIAVSASFHWGTSIKEILENMRIGRGNYRHCGNWEKYVRSWQSVSSRVATIKYEDLLSDGVNVLKNLLNQLGHPIRPLKIAEVYARQRFSFRKRHIQMYGDSYNLGKEFNLKFMRKGIAGDWENYFNHFLAAQAHLSFGHLLMELGYESDPNWWKKIP